MNKKISVLMTVYNCQDYLKNSIISILNQKYKNFELIIVDDGSNDESFNVIKLINDRRIKLYKLNKNIGRTKALNFGLKKCKSEIIAIQDADDIAHPLRLYKTLERLTKKKDLGMVCSNYEFINSEDVIIKNFDYFRINKNILSKIKFINMIPHSSIIFKKNFSKNYIFKYDENFKYAQDYDLILKCLRDSKIEFINKKLVKIRIHKNNMTNTKIYKKVKIIENLKLLNFSEEYFTNNLTEILRLKINKIKNYTKLILNFMGM